MDTSKFKDGIDIERAINIIFWMLDGLGAQEQEKRKSLSLEQIDYDELLLEMHGYWYIYPKAPTLNGKWGFGYSKNLKSKGMAGSFLRL